MIGTRLAHFSITAKLGEGGMGAVYRAEDTRLGREVAIKVLPEALVGDPDRLARFEREARVLASLDHPSIAGVYEVGHETPEGAAEPIHYLVMQLAPGETLEERLDRGPVPADDAVPIALRIAEALEAAHEKGIVHRDLKPANVKVDGEGRVKVLDFGLAKALEGEAAEAPSSDLTHSPTLTGRATMGGMLFGTAPYMSPEQARGLPADRRSDVWAFGVLLWEMLAGRRLFGGDTVSDSLAAVLRDEVRLDALPADSPPALRRLLDLCLRRDPARRLHDIADVRILLEDVERGAGAPETGPEAPPARRGLLPPILAAVAGLAVGALGAGLWRATEAPVGPRDGAPPLHVSLNPPEGVSVMLHANGPGPMAPSPDGRKILYAGFPTDDPRRVALYVQDLTTGRSARLEGTDGAQYPFWSPDSRSIGFFTQRDGTMKRIAAAGGPAVTVAEAIDGKGGTWGADGTIVFAPSYSSGLFRVAADGTRETAAVTTIDERLHNSHRHPRFLPDGERFLFLARTNDPLKPSELMLGSLDGGEPRRLMPIVSQVEPAGDSLFFVRDSTLFAQPYDPATGAPDGAAVPVAEDVAFEAGASFSAFAVSESGLLAIHPGALTDLTAVTLEWRDRDGAVLGTVGDPMFDLWTVAPAPDGERAAVSSTAPNAGQALWLLDLRAGLRTRLTEEAGDQLSPVWLHDGSGLIYASNRDPHFGIYRLDLGGPGEPETLVNDPGVDQLPLDVTPDDRQLLYCRQDPDETTDLWLLPLAGDDRTPRLFLEDVTTTDFAQATISPDGSLVAYTGSDGDDLAIFLTTFPRPGPRVRVSSADGTAPQWRGDGRELFYVDSEGRLLSVDVASGSPPRVGGSRELFRVARPAGDGIPYAAMPDGDRFLVAPAGTSSRGSQQASLILDWRRAVREATDGD